MRNLRARSAGQARILGNAGRDLVSLGRAGRHLRLQALTSSPQDLRGPPGSLPLSTTAGRFAKPIRDATRQQAIERDLQRETEAIAFGQPWGGDPPKAEG